MPIPIHIIIDQYLHRWDTPAGELWFCVRAFVASADDARAWADKPDVMDSNLYDVQFMRSNAVCPVEMIPINLPTPIDIWHNVPDTAGKARWTRYRRSVSCRNDKGIPFPVLFNQMIRDRVPDTTKDVAQATKAALELMFLTGSREKLADFSDRYATHGQANPPLLLDGGNSITSMFWLLGLMHRIGGKDKLAALQNLKHYDVVLSWDQGPIDETAPQFDPTLSRSLSLPTAEASPVGDAERAFFAPEDPAQAAGHWLPALPASSMPAQLAATIEGPVAPDWLFVKPIRRNLEAGKAPDGLPLFQVSTADKQSATPDGAIESREFQASVGTRTLLAVELEAEFNAEPAPTSPDTLLQPGIRLSGRLRPYRRFPLQPVPSTGSPADADRVRLPTIMAFEADPDCAADLAMLLEESGAEAALIAALAKAKVVETIPDNVTVPPADQTGWTVELVSVADLPWDDPGNRSAMTQIKSVVRTKGSGGGRQLRVLASPSKADAHAAAGEPRVLTNATLDLFVNRGAPISLAQTTQFKTVHAAPDGTSTPYWHIVQLGRPTAAPPSFNALSAVSTSSLAIAPKLRVTAMFDGEYEFERALSTTSLEGVVKITTATPEMVDQIATGFAAGAPSPSRTDAEERANFNTLHQVDEAGNVRDHFTQITRPLSKKATAAQCDNALLGITQVMPFGRTWPESARDNRQANNDQVNATPQNWEAIRTHVRLIYQVDPSHAESPSLDLSLRHTFGEVLPVTKPLIPAQLAWPVELATSAEQRNTSAAPNARDERPFMRVVYGAGKKTATFVFDPTVLVFSAPPPVPGEGETETAAANSARRKAEQICNAGTLAWRSLAEILDLDAKASITLRPVEYDLFDRNDAKANTLASTGKANALASSWRGALRDRDPIVISDTDFTTQLRDRATQWFAAADPSTIPFSFTVAVPDLTAANIARFELTVERAPNRNSEAAELKPVSARLRTDSAVPSNAYYRSYADTLEGTWAQKFTATWKPDDEAVNAATVWRGPRKRMTDSITPQDLPDFDAKAFADTVRGLREGSDWFPPIGTIDYSGTTITPVLIPCGFASPAQHPDLAELTEPALVALLSTLQDYYDLAFQAGNVAPDDPNRAVMPWKLAEWKSTFAKIEASVDGLGALARRLCEILLWAQPGSSGVTPLVATRVTQINNSKRTGTHALLERSAMLLANRPALYASMKALLVTELTSAGARDLRHVAGARFQRLTQPWTSTPSQTNIVTVSLDVPQLVTLDALAGNAVEAGVAFVEPLDDVTYDNAFDVADVFDKTVGQLVEPFEAVVDPKAFKGGTGLWATALPKTPLAEQNTGSQKRRSVHLASRRPVTPPILLGALGLGTATNGGLPAGANYELGDLLAGRPPKAGGPLVVAATRAAPGSPILYQDELFRMVYIIRGDEEGDTGSSSLFINDVFTVEATPQEGTARSSTPPDPMSVSLRTLVKEPPRSREARDAVAALASSLDKVGTTYVTPPTPAPQLPSVGFRIEPAGIGWTIEPLTDANKKELWPEWLRNVSVLRTPAAAALAAQSGGPDLGTAVLVLDMVTSVWREAQFSLLQTRNAQLAGGFVFADQFRSAASQKTPPAVHRVARRSVNPPGYWNDAARPKRPAKITVDSLLASVSKMKMAQQTGGPNPALDLYDPAAAKMSGYRLTVTLYQEQFLRPMRQGVPLPDPSGRLLVAAYHARMGTSDINDEIVFPPEVRTFSIDLQWTTQTGEAAMRLERLFLEA